jgi:hypothetical protein
MEKEKQIEEMANAYYEAMLKARETLGSMNEGAPKWYAKELYAKGYRKASDVAEDIIRILRAAGINEHRYPVIAKIKKKYTEDVK